MFVRHRVADYAAWRQAYDDFDSDRRPLGVIGEAVYQSIDDPRDVTVWHDFESPDEARAFAASDALRNVMQNAGVEGRPDVWFVAIAG